MRKVYKPFDMKNHHNVYTLGQAWQVYTGNDVTYRPLEGFIAEMVIKQYGPALSENEFLGMGMTTWEALHMSYDENTIVRIIEDVLGMTETNIGLWDFAALGDWIVVLVDKGDADPDVIHIKRDPDGKWYRGDLKSIEDLE